MATRSAWLVDSPSVMKHLQKMPVTVPLWTLALPTLPAARHGTNSSHLPAHVTAKRRPHTSPRGRWGSLNSLSPLLGVINAG